jgi:hypothetical protein
MWQVIAIYNNVAILVCVSMLLVLSSLLIIVNNGIYRYVLLVLITCHIVAIGVVVTIRHTTYAGYIRMGDSYDSNDSIVAIDDDYLAVADYVM